MRFYAVASHFFTDIKFKSRDLKKSVENLPTSELTINLTSALNNDFLNPYKAT